MRRTTTTVAVCACLLLGACGGDDDEREPAGAVTAPADTEAATTGTGTTETEPPANEGDDGAQLGSADEEAIREVVLAAATNREPCEHLTERYKREFVFEDVTSDDPDEACEEAESAQPQLLDSDVEITGVTGGNGRAQVKFQIAGIAQSASLVQEDGRWLIDKFEF